MENTLENKARFLSLHVTQRLDDLYYNAIIRGVVQVGISSKNWIVKTQHLKIPVNEVCLPLKPLSSITNEDAIEVGRIVFPNLNDTQLILVKDGIVTMFESGWNVNGFKMLQIFDYLRSKGYALPWMGLSVEKQIQYGWVKLKEG